jgi:hypothetical protein
MQNVVAAESAAVGKDVARYLIVVLSRLSDLTQLAQFEASFWILSRVALNQIKELSAQKCLHRRIVTTKVVDVSR